MTERTPTLPTTLSYSQIDLFLRCPQQWARKYVYGQPIPATFPMLVGQVVHDAFAAALIARYYGQRRNDIQAIGRSVAVNTGNRPIDWQDESPQTLTDAAAYVTASTAFNDLLDTIVPLADDNGPLIERGIDFTVPGCNRPVVGYIDVQTADAVIDLKVTHTRWNADKASGAVQGLFYTYPQRNRRPTFVHAVLTLARRGVELNLFSNQYDPGQYTWLERLIATTNAAMSSGFWPPNYTGWGCSAAQCPFYADCRLDGTTYPKGIP